MTSVADPDDPDELTPSHAEDPPGSPIEPPLPKRVAWLGLALAGSAFLPLAPDGRRFVDFVLEAFSRSLLEGVLTVCGLGSPFLFGVATAVASQVPTPALAARLVRAPIAIMHSQLVLVAWTVFSRGDAIAALPLLGFSIVSGIYFAVHLASAGAGDRGPSLRWHIRWGAMLIMAIAAWARLQLFAGIFFGVALTLALLSAALLLRATRTEPLVS